MSKRKQENILVIGDTHIPFEHSDYLEFCVKTKEKYKCSTIVHIGDLVDHHSINYHEHDPDGYSPKDEMREADLHLKGWFKEFPELYLCIGNHDSLVERKSKTFGLPSRVFKSYSEMWKLPAGWKDSFEWEFNDVLFTHGTNRSGKLAHLQAAYDNRQSTVIGHLHSAAGLNWIANSKDCIFGMNVGCGIDRKKYAFAYGKDLRAKPIIGCGVVFNRTEAQFIPMDLGRKIVYKR